MPATANSRTNKAQRMISFSGATIVSGFPVVLPGFRAPVADFFTDLDIGLSSKA